ncbi:hypothetical protein H5410_050252 [Solanum commersonii]|uniref:Uncharacterized protein n=1 Tax=Solanum commersonii TaxID=4109 RepID=A0A9J5WUY3_SOLCO|nr:hypothetical protein H5410_050252 [Solanum commersonii]
MSTISPVNIAETSPPNPQSPFDLNNPTPSHRPGPYSTMLSNHLFEGDLPKGVVTEEGEIFLEDILGISQPVFDQIPEIDTYPSSNSTDTDEDNRPLKWSMQKRMVPVSTKGKEKVTEATPRRRPSTRAVTQKIMGDAMKSSEKSTTENRRKKKFGEAVFKIPVVGVVDVSIKDSQTECREEPPLKTSKRKSRASVSKRVDSEKEKCKDSQKRREPSKKKRELSPTVQQTSALGPGPKRKHDDQAVSKHIIISNLCVQRVLGGRVFDPDIITKPGMDSLYDLVLHQEEVREFYYNIEFTEDGSINSRTGSLGTFNCVWMSVAT